MVSCQTQGYLASEATIFTKPFVEPIIHISTITYNDVNIMHFFARCIMFPYLYYCLGDLPRYIYAHSIDLEHV